MKNLFNSGCGRQPQNGCCNNYPCGNFPSLSGGLRGESGKSAYQLAVENGYVGTLQQWLNSLNGKSAYQLAVENGYVGTEAEWLESLKAAFEPGESLFEIETPSGAVQVGYGDSLIFESESMDISVDPETGAISIESRAGGTDLQFHSNANDPRLQSGAGGERAYVILVGNGYESIINAGGVVTTLMPLHSQKVLKASVVKEVHAEIRISLAQSDFPSTIYAQLFLSQNFLSAEFTPIPETLMELGTFESGAPVGSAFAGSVKNLNINVPAESQLMIGFYNITADGGLTAGTVGYLSGVVRLEEN